VDCFFARDFVFAVMYDEGGTAAASQTLYPFFLFASGAKFFLLLATWLAVLSGLRPPFLDVVRVMVLFFFFSPMRDSLCPLFFPRLPVLLPLDNHYR